MKPRICICCGEPMAAVGGAAERNPNLCLACASIGYSFEANWHVSMEETSEDPLNAKLPAGLERTRLELSYKPDELDFPRLIMVPQALAERMLVS